MSRLRISRPNASVPKTYLASPPSIQNGGNSLSRSVWSRGEWGASCGASRAMSTMLAMMRSGIKGGLRIGTVSGKPNPRIHVGVKDVDHEIDRQNEDRLQYDHRLQEREVSVDHGLIGEATNARP